MQKVYHNITTLSTIDIGLYARPSQLDNVTTLIYNFTTPKQKGGVSVEKPDEETISGAEFARRLGVDRSAVTRWVREKKLEPVSDEMQGFKPKPRYRAADVERIRTLMRNAGSARRRAAALT